MAGFFDTLFSGGAEREAAERNRAALGQYQQQGTGFLETGLNKSVGAVTDASTQAKDLFGKNYDLYGAMRGAGTGILDTGRDASLAALERAGAAYDPLAALGTKYGAGTDLYLDSLGTRGAEGNARAVDAFSAGPGYDFIREQGLEALNRRRVAAGMLQSGNADIDALTYGTGLANQTYGSWQDRLAGLINPELAATQGAATGRAGIGRDIANVYGADTAARLGLEGTVTGGQAGANTAQAANALGLGNSLSGLYTGHAGNQVGLAGNVTSGNLQANQLQAQGEASGARNLMNAGLGLASLATGGLGGGLFSGLGSGLSSLASSGLGSLMGNQWQLENTGGFGSSYQGPRI